MAKAVDQKFELERLRKVAKSRGGRCLSPKYSGSTIRLRFTCRNGHRWSAIPASVNQGVWCSVCAGNAKSSIEEIAALAKANGFACLSTTYRGSHTKLDFNCMKCGKNFQKTPTGLKSGKGCRHCHFARLRTIQTTPIAEIKKIAHSKGVNLVSKNYSGKTLKVKCVKCRNVSEMTLAGLKGCSPD